MSRLALTRAARFIMASTLFLSTLAVVGQSRVSHAATAPAGLRTLTMTAAHPTFPTTISTGWLAIHVVTDVHGGLYFGVGRVKAGAAMADIKTASAAGDLVRLGALVTFLGGIGVPAQSTGTVILDLRRPGHYGMHLQRQTGERGQDLFFTVVQGGVTAVAPAAALSITLTGTRFVGLPPALPAGATTFKITNRSSWIRDLSLFRLDPGKTVHDVVVAVRMAAQTHHNPSWLHDAGGADMLSPAQATWVTLHLRPGAYVALCPLPNPQKGGESFSLEGMIATFTVS